MNREPEMSKRLYLKPLLEDDGIISVTMERTPRWKESELSGDEWRYSLETVVTVKNWVEGGTEILFVRGKNFAEMALKTAAKLDELLFYGDQRAVPYSVKDKDDILCCFQPGCDARPVVVLRITQEWTRHPNQGFRMERASRRGGEEPIVVRAFCDDHKHRGDCDLEDSDRNYTPLEDTDEITS